MRNIAILIVAATLIAGCGQEPAKPQVASPTETPEEALHRKARAAQMGDLVGYDGKKLQKDLDKIIDNSSKRAKDLEGVDR